MTKNLRDITIKHLKKTRGVDLKNATDEELSIYLKSIKMGGFADLLETVKSYEK